MDPDIESRLNLKLESGGGSWDEVVAFTERILNKNFQAIWDQNLDFRQVQWDRPSGEIIDIQLDPPRIIIPGQEDMLLAKTVYFQMRFASGYIATGTGTAQADVEKWELAVPVDLNTHEPSWHPVPMEDGKLPRRQCTVNGRIYNFPGDYSVQRLFAQLSTAKWNEPNAKYSLVWNKETKKHMTIEEWKDIGYNKKLWDVLKNTLQSWATDQEDAGRSTLNVTFQLPTENYDNETPGVTYAPTFLHQQTYPYISPTKGVAKGETNLKGNGYNSLLWCEMVDDRSPPSTLAIPWTGNFAVPPRSNAGDDGIDGTFAVSYTLFFEKHLLPRLFRFNQAVEVTNLKETYSMKNGTYHTEWNYSIGNFDKDSNDKYFEFTRVLPASTEAGSEDCVKYVFEKPHTTDQNIHVWQSGHAAKLIHKSNCTVTVSWELGGKTVYVHGYTEYEFDQTHAKNSNFAAGDQTGHLRYKYYLNWDISLVLQSIEGGTMKWVVKGEGRDGKPKGNVEVTQDNTIQENMVTPPKQDENIRKWFTENIARCVDQLPKDLARDLNTSAHFTYPGAGQLDFSAPAINRWGNILATVTHKQLAADPNYITVNAALKMPLPELLGIQPKVSTCKVGVPPPVCELDWKLTPAIGEAFKQKSVFTLTATNNKIPPAPLGFGYVKFRFSSASTGSNMFRHNKINGKTNSYYKPPAVSTPTAGPGSEVGPKDKENPNPPSQGQGKAGGRGKKILEGLKGAISSTPTPAQTEKAEPSVASPSGTAPKPQPPVEDMGLITVSTSSPSIDIDKNIQLEIAMETQGNQIWWQAATTPAKDGPGFVIQPGESISYTFEMDTGAAKEYYFLITESWRQPNDLKKRMQPFFSDDKMVTLTLKPT